MSFNDPMTRRAKIHFVDPTTLEVRYDDEEEEAKPCAHVTSGIDMMPANSYLINEVSEK